MTRRRTLALLSLAAAFTLVIVVSAGRADAATVGSSDSCNTHSKGWDDHVTQTSMWRHGPGGWSFTAMSWVGW